MPGRQLPLIVDQYYHVFNRGIDRRTTFTSKREYERGLATFNFYRFSSPSVKLSRFLTFSRDDQTLFLQDLVKTERLIAVIAYCLMPNHYHFLVKQLAMDGVARFLSNFQNSYTRYFNLRHQRIGALFENQFKAVLVETNEQLLHLSRYIHLNPYSSYVVKTTDDLTAYR